MENQFTEELYLDEGEHELSGYRQSIMTSSNGNIFCVTGLLPVTWSFDVFFRLRLNRRFNEQSTHPGDLRRHCVHYDVTLMGWQNHSCRATQAIWRCHKLRCHGPFTRYVKLWVAHTPGIPGTFSQTPISKKPLVNDSGMHHGTCVMHVPWCMSGSLACGGGENVPGIPGACATRNFTYLVRGPLAIRLVTASGSMQWYRPSWFLPGW